VTTNVLKTAITSAVAEAETRNVRDAWSLGSAEA
jgi:hypothetical protein